VSPALVVGADGLIGARLLQELRGRGTEAFGTSRRATGKAGDLHLDLSDPPEALLDDPALRSLRTGAPWSVFLAAGVTGLAECANDPTGTRRINVTNLTALASGLVRSGAFVVYPSSSAVFGDDTRTPQETSVPAPRSEYGRQKADAERALLDLAPRAAGRGGVAILRLTKVVAPTGRIGRWIETLRGGGDVEAADDLRLSPISLGFAARGLIRLADAGRSGVYHLAGDSVLSWYEFARRLAVALAVDPSRIRPARAGIPDASIPTLDMSASREYSGLPAQPLDSVLDELISKTRG